MSETKAEGAGQVEEFGPHVVVRSFKKMIRGVLVVMPEGKVITDHMLITACLEGGDPIRPVEESGSYVCCPNCKNVFKAESVRVLPSVLKAARPAA